MRLDRTNTSLIGKWWWTIDRPTLLALFTLICVGAILVTAASPPVAERLGYTSFYFVKRQQIYLLLSLIIMFLVSLMTPTQVRRVAMLGFGGSLLLMMALPLIGYENKGAIRWMMIGSTSIQPSEFLKPCMAVVMAWIFSLRQQSMSFPGWRIAMALYALVAFLLLIQPDLGMTMVISLVWAMQFFLAGLPFIWVVLLLVAGVAGLWGAYLIFPHVSKRIDSFLDPSSGDNYQIGRSLEAFQNGQWMGVGPGEGKVKQFIPDSHTDFVFSVVGEEFGLFACLVVVSLFAFIVLRGLYRIRREGDSFIFLAVAGLLGQFGIQALINMGVAVNLLPAKGMTLPFLSYGGSSLLAIALGMGMMLALTRRRYGIQR